MKRLFALLFVMVVGTAVANTININWMNNGSVYDTSTCTVGGNLVLPSTDPTPARGYHFIGWEPQEYIFLEYIESTGTQYIDTGYIANGGMIIEAKAAPGGTNGSYTFWLGSIGPSTGDPDYTRNLIAASNVSTLSFQKGRVYSGAGYAFQNNDPIVVYMDTTGTEFIAKVNGGATINVNPYGIQQTLTGLTTTVKLGYDDYSSSVRAMTIYYFKMWDNNGNLIRNMIPAKHKSNAIGMYDTVTNTFFTNAGTGTFIAGPEVQ